MATANVKFTQEQIDNLSGVAKKYGGFQNENFKNAVNTKYGVGSYESLNSSLSSINEAQKAKKAGMGGTNQQGQVDMQTPANAQSFSASVTPVAANIGGTNPNAPQQPQPEAKTNLNTPKTVVQTAQATVAPPVVEKTTTITPEGQTVVKKETPGISVEETKRIADVSARNAQVEITNGLNNTWRESPDLFKDQATFRASQGYDTATPETKKVLDAYFQAKAVQQNNPDALFQQLLSNQTIYNKETINTPAFKTAQSRMNDFSVNSGLSSKEIADKIKNGSMPINSQAYKDLQLSNPKLIQDAERINTLNIGNGKPVNSNEVEVNVSNNLTKNIPDEEVPTYKKMLEKSPEVKTALEKTKATRDRIAEIQDTLDRLEDETKKDYEGKTISGSYIQAVISEKSKSLLRELNTLSRTYSGQVADLQYYSNIVKEDYETSKEERKIQSDRAYQEQLAEKQFGRQVKLGEIQNKYQESRDVMNYKQELYKMGLANEFGMKKDNMNFEQQKQLTAIQNKYQNSRDVMNFEQELAKMEYGYKNDPSNVAKQMENMSNMPNASVTASGTQSNVMVGNKNIIVDSVGASGLENANAELKAAGIPVIAASGFRDQTATIRNMADRYGIAFNESNPSETAQTLRKAGHQVANPGQSKHESGMAIDVYKDKNLGAVSKEQEAILNKNGWFSAGIPGDAGHFEYKGVQNNVLKKIPESAQKRIDSYSDDYTKNPNVQSAFKFAPLLRQYNNIDVKNLSSSQRQGIISDYAKALDPDSVVREGEYATVAKYSSSFGEKTLSEINQFLSGNGTLSDNAAKKVIDAINTRGKNYIEQEKNIRNQYIDKINRISGDNRGEQELVFPDYANGGQSNTQPQTSNQNDVNAILNEWNTRNQL